jgi:hypothetical protein
MSNVETLQTFARFEAARAITDVLDIDVAVLRSDGSTDLHIPSPWWELTPALFSVAPKGVKPTGSVESGSAPDEPPVSDFDVLDELRTPEGQIRRQITAFRRGGGVPYREHLARRLDSLMGALEEEEEPWAEDSPDSLRQMLLFLRAAPDLRCPIVTITPSATFRAQWQDGQNSHLAVDFLPDGQVRFVVFSPDPLHSDRVQRVSGIVSRPDLMRAIELYKVYRWAADART